MDELFDRLRDGLAPAYTVEREIGRGGMASVFLAREREIGRDVAIKVLDLPIAGRALRDRFLREIRLVAQLDHPHIVPVFQAAICCLELDRGCCDFVYFVMRYVAGESLRARLRRDQILSVDEALRIGCDVADALEYAHAHGIIHRDIKPENILLADGHALVADFGIARALDGEPDEALTKPGSPIGTPAYMSPEQAMASDEIDGRTDVYSLGCVLFEMLVGRRASVTLDRRGLTQKSRAALDEWRRGQGRAGKAIERMLLRALAPAPADRFPSAAALRAALVACARPGRSVAGWLGRLFAV